MLRNILQAEEAIFGAFESLKHTDVSQFLTPDGYNPEIRIQDIHGRKKRSDASIGYWNPGECQILITFSKRPEQHSQGEQHREHQDSSAAGLPKPSQERQADDSEIRAVCSILNETERQGRSFIALKWFRDSVLPTKEFFRDYTREELQTALTKAIATGKVVTSRITNPRSPFPTTTIRLSRAQYTAPVGEPRFSPVPVRGEPLSTTILRDRGPR